MQPTKAATKIRCEDGIQATSSKGRSSWGFNLLWLFHIIMNLAKVSRNTAILPTGCPDDFKRPGQELEQRDILQFRNLAARTSGLLSTEHTKSAVTTAHQTMTVSVVRWVQYDGVSDPRFTNCLKPRRSMTFCVHSIIRRLVMWPYSSKDFQSTEHILDRSNYEC